MLNLFLFFKKQQPCFEKNLPWTAASIEGHLDCSDVWTETSLTPTAQTLQSQIYIRRAGAEASVWAEIDKNQTTKLCSPLKPSKVTPLAANALAQRYAFTGIIACIAKVASPVGRVERSVYV